MIETIDYTISLIFRLGIAVVILAFGLMLLAFAIKIFKDIKD